MPLFEYEAYDGPLWEGIIDKATIERMCEGQMAKLPKEAQVKAVPNMDDLGTTYYIWCTDEWRQIQPGDTYKGRVIIPVPPDPLPLEKQFVGGMRLIRGWNTDNDGMLRSLSASFVWKPNTSMQAHEIPRLNGHHCGFFGFIDWDFSMRELQHVPILGTYYGWGRSVKATSGFRCEWARIESLVFDVNQYADGEAREAAEELYRKVSKKYEVPVIGRPRAERLKYGIIPLSEDKIK